MVRFELVTLWTTTVHALSVFQVARQDSLLPPPENKISDISHLVQLQFLGCAASAAEQPVCFSLPSLSLFSLTHPPNRVFFPAIYRILTPNFQHLPPSLPTHDITRLPPQGPMPGSTPRSEPPLRVSLNLQVGNQQCSDQRPPHPPPAWDGCWCASTSSPSPWMRAAPPHIQNKS